MSLGFGIVGCGTIAAWHAEGIRQCSLAHLAGVTDTRLENANRFAQKWETHAFASMDELLDSPDVEVICLCTPSGLHAEQTLRAIQVGKHVLVEKPMALNVRDCDRVIEAAQKQGVQVGVVSQFRFTNTCQRLKREVDGGHLGRIVTADVFMKYFRDPAYYAGSGWRGTWAMDGGGALMNQGIHGVDSLLYLMGNVRHVYGLAHTLRHDIEVEDTAAAVLEFEQGALGIVQGTTSVYPGYPRRLSISGTRGTITITEQLFTEWDIQGEACPDDIILGGEQRSGASIPTNFDVEGHRLHIQDMAEAVVYGRRPAVDALEAKRAVELITAIYDSSRTGRRVTLMN